jgi:hypothetical protein
MFDDESDFASEDVAFEVADAGQVELVDQLAVNATFELFEVVFTRLVGAAAQGQRF